MQKAIEVLEANCPSFFTHSCSKALALLHSQHLVELIRHKATEEALKWLREKMSPMRDVRSNKNLFCIVLKLNLVVAQTKRGPKCCLFFEPKQSN